MRPLRTTLIALTVALAACNNTDARTSEGVKERLAREPNPELVDVTTRDRIVTLRGFVDSPAEQQRLESAAREIPGVLGWTIDSGSSRPWRQRMPTSSAACETTM